VSEGQFYGPKPLPLRRKDDSGNPAVTYDPNEIGVRAFIGISNRSQLEEEDLAHSVESIFIHRKYE